MSVTNIVRYAALLAAMFISFDTQRELALSHGISDTASYAVPVAVDLFLIWAVRVRRDIVAAVAIAVSANVAGVLSVEDLRAISTWVGAALHAVFPVTVWRMHRTAPDTSADVVDSDRTEAHQTPTEAPQAEPLMQDMSAGRRRPGDAHTEPHGQLAGRRTLG